MSNFDVLNPGTPVSLIWYAGSEPQSVIATVFSSSPLAVEVSESTGAQFEAGSQIKVLFQNAGQFETADAQIKTVTKFGARWRFELEKVEWVKADRRSSKRFEAKLLVKCRLVAEESNGVHIREFAVTTHDISTGGAWVDSDIPTKPGTILKCEISTTANSTVRALAVVAWSDPNGRGFGVEFLDFVGPSKELLTTFIGGLAA